MAYAENTEVSVEKSKSEIERLIGRYGAERFGSGWSGNRAMIEFEAEERRVRFMLTLPDRNDEVFWLTPGRKNERSAQQAEAAWEQACRSKWRSLMLVVKAKLEAVESGISVFEDEFMAQIVMPNNQTVSELARPMIAKAYKSGQMPRSFLALPAPSKEEVVAEVVE